MINYPNKINKKTKTKIYGNRGMTLESEINDSNLYYLENNIGVIYKKPTPIQVVEEKSGKITKAFFKTPSTTDYNGLYKGYYIDFEAKETTSKTSFPLANIHPHQIKHMNNIINNKGICFIIVRFTTINKTYLIFANDFINFINTEKRKSIPITYFNEKAYLIKDKLAPRIDYLEIIEKYGGIK